MLLLINIGPSGAVIWWFVLAYGKLWQLTDKTWQFIDKTWSVLTYGPRKLIWLIDKTWQLIGLKPKPKPEPVSLYSVMEEIVHQEVLGPSGVFCLILVLSVIGSILVEYRRARKRNTIQDLEINRIYQYIVDYPKHPKRYVWMELARYFVKILCRDYRVFVILCYYIPQIIVATTFVLEPILYGQLVIFFQILCLLIIVLSCKCMVFTFKYLSSSFQNRLNMLRSEPDYWIRARATYRWMLFLEEFNKKYSEYIRVYCCWCYFVGGTYVYLNFTSLIF